MYCLVSVPVVAAVAAVSCIQASGICCRLLDLVSNGSPGHGPVHLLVDGAASLGFRWCPDGFCWSRPGLPRMPTVISILKLLS